MAAIQRNGWHGESAGAWPSQLAYSAADKPGNAMSAS